MYRLENVLRPYAWGSTTAIAELFGREPSGKPEAELWIGAHPGAPSTALLLDGSRQPLDELIAADTATTLGAESVAAFGGRLPFLAKVLAAGSALSLQVHPTLEQARAGYAAEEAAGVPREAAHRNYKDDNHKPEMIFALSDFEALCGFRAPEESADVLAAAAALIAGTGAAVPDVLSGLIEGLRGTATEEERLRNAFESLLAGGSTVADAVQAVAAAARNGTPEGPYAREFATVAELDAEYPGDPGVLVSLLLNRASLQPGEALYLPAGNIHAYLSGLGVEVMASSDNVLRGGLTPKHVDVPELMRTVQFAALGLPLVEADRSELGQEIYRPPFREFQLQRIELAPGDAPVPVAQNGPLVVLAVAGTVVLDSPRSDLRLERGDSAFVPASEAPVNAHPVAGADSTAVAFAVTTAVPGPAAR